MTYYDLKTVNTSIEDTLAAAAGLVRSQDLADLTENIPSGDMPLIQVLPTTWNGAAFSDTHTKSFGGRGTNTTPFQPKTWTYTVFVYVAPVAGAKFSEVMVKLVTIAAAIQDIIDEQTVEPLFGNEAIKSFQYSAERGIIPYSGVDHYGFTITISCSIW